MHANPAAALGIIKVLTRRIRILSDLTSGLTADQFAALANHEAQ
jgi:hypothetical protein